LQEFPNVPVKKKARTDIPESKIKILKYQEFPAVRKKIKDFLKEIEIQNSSTSFTQT